MGPAQVTTKALAAINRKNEIIQIWRMKYESKRNYSTYVQIARLTRWSMGYVRTVLREHWRSAT